MAERTAHPAERYAAVVGALVHAREQINRAMAAYEVGGASSDGECDRLGDVVDAALALAVHAEELAFGADVRPHRQLYARISLASRAADLAADAIHTPMDAPLAYVSSAAMLLGAAVEAM
jgi:hypothetical protein